MLVATPLTAGEQPIVLDGFSAREAVAKGNRHLLEAKPNDALEAYKHAEELRPDAREIAFVQGLAYHDQNEFDKAREAFERVAASGNDTLALDALYSLGASDHVEALQSVDDPELALSRLESAMRKYHTVLDEQPKHRAARDANFKAASMWRQLKQQMQQQPQEGSGENENEDQKEGDQQEQDREQSQEQDQQNDPQEQDEQQNEQQPSDSSEQSEQEQQQSAAQEKEQVSREQARRQLREMMQALRERKKTRETTRKMPVAAVDKDW